ncbi:MAG TPA: D-cysteine desulfhydrase family protein [Marine Group III euryarchaeote]|uniref:D-cysteine desulfhydrase family protein n=1 Tax=Marine Group III euryarchaeote TaxID=2173149 RepID=A0A7J4CZD4_9ARCH|nr:D-cysteine desulfhydrase family protein [Marine Group III euryarchaeote]
MSTPLEKRLNDYPRIELTRTPTPLQYLPNLSDSLNLKIYIKRDDLTDLVLGGDKARKLEYEIAEAKAHGCDTLVTCGSAQSNLARLTTAAARKCGMEVSVVLSKDDYTQLQGNLLTVVLMGATIKIVETGDHWDLEEHALALCDDLTEQGRRPHYIPVSGTTPLSCLGYVRGGLEIVNQMKGTQLNFDHVYTPFGTGGIFTALLFTFRHSHLESAFHGISVNRLRSQCVENLETLWEALTRLLDGDMPVPQEGHQVYDQFIGKEYGDPTDSCLEAISIMAKREGILLDPVYSGKMFSGFLEHHRNDCFNSGDHILLLHSGGVPALFAYQNALKDYLQTDLKEYM